MRIGTVASLWTFLCCPAAAFAQVVDCGRQSTELPPDVQERIQGDVEGKAQLFTKLLGDAALKGTVEASKTELQQKYKDVDKAQMDRYMSWVSCQSIMQDKTLTTSDKNRLWVELYREIMGVGKEKQSVQTESSNAAVDLHFPDVATLDIDQFEDIIDKKHYSGRWTGPGDGSRDFNRTTDLNNHPFELLYEFGYGYQIFRITMKNSKPPYREDRCDFGFKAPFPDLCRAVAYVQTIYGPRNQIQLSMPDISEEKPWSIGDCEMQTVHEKLDGVKGDLKFEVVVTGSTARFLDRAQGYRTGSNKTCDVSVTWQTPYERK